MGAKTLHIRFDTVDGFTKSYDGTRHLVLFGPERSDAIYDRTRNLISEKVILQTWLMIIFQELELNNPVLYL